jgi:hypothetical protein
MRQARLMKVGSVVAATLPLRPQVSIANGTSGAETAPTNPPKSHCAGTGGSS